MFDIPKLYIPACSNSVQLIPLHPIVIPILLHHYKELIKCISDVEPKIEDTKIQKLRLGVKQEEPSL